MRDLFEVYTTVGGHRLVLSRRVRFSRLLVLLAIVYSGYKIGGPTMNEIKIYLRNGGRFHVS